MIVAFFSLIPLVCLINLPPAKHAGDRFMIDAVCGTNMSKAERLSYLSDALDLLTAELPPSNVAALPLNGYSPFEKQLREGNSLSSQRGQKR